MPKQKPIGRSSKTSPLIKSFNGFKLHPSDKQRVIENFYIALDTPVSLSCYMLYKYEEFDQLVQKELRPSDYNDGLKFRDDFAAVSFLRKNERLKTSFQKKENALLAFAEAEEKCKATNNYLKGLISGRISNDRGVQLLNKVARKIEHILGRFCIDEVLDKCSWGPGVTLTVKGENTSGARKFDIDRDITRDAYALFGDLLPLAYPAWEAVRDVNYQVGNTIITVPKNAKIDRTIAIEPGINSWLQLGIGKSIRRRLRCSGFNLDSDLKNQRGAYIGSLDGSLCTIDFKAASDTISVELVRLLLPNDWFLVLNAARSHYYKLDGETRRSEKFSTMGNGFTFELESLIFVALALVVTQELEESTAAIAIFGDDLIVPSTCYDEVYLCSELFGFTINHQKSFKDGYFRESCGSFYFNGIDVKPLFFKKDLSRTKELYRFANAISNLAHTRNEKNGRDVKFRSIWSLVIHLLPESLRFFGPMSCGDSAIHSNICDAVATPARDGWEGFTFPAFPEVSIDVEMDSLGLLLSRLNKRSRDAALSNCISLRERTRTVFKKRMYVHLWYELGNWF